MTKDCSNTRAQRVSDRIHAVDRAAWRAVHSSAQAMSRACARRGHTV
jgi:hypothetical protein